MTTTHSLPQSIIRHLETGEEELKEIRRTYISHILSKDLSLLVQKIKKECKQEKKKDEFDLTKWNLKKTQRIQEFIKGQLPETLNEIIEQLEEKEDFSEYNVLNPEYQTMIRNEIEIERRSSYNKLVEIATMFFQQQNRTIPTNIDKVGPYSFEMISNGELSIIGRVKADTMGSKYLRKKEKGKQIYDWRGLRILTDSDEGSYKFVQKLYEKGCTDFEKYIFAATEKRPSWIIIGDPLEEGTPTKDSLITGNKNGYKAIHVVIKPINHKRFLVETPIELQIMPTYLHDINEFIAPHAKMMRDNQEWLDKKCDAFEINYYEELFKL